MFYTYWVEVDNETFDNFIVFVNEVLDLIPQHQDKVFRREAL